MLGLLLYGILLLVLLVGVNVLLNMTVRESRTYERRPARGTRPHRPSDAGRDNGRRDR